MGRNLAPWRKRMRSRAGAGHPGAMATLAKQPRNAAAKAQARHPRKRAERQPRRRASGEIFDRFADGRGRRRAPSWRIRNPFTLLVAVVLSAQATDVSVNKATANACSPWPTRRRRCWRWARRA